MKRPSKPVQDLITVSEFYRLVPDGQKADLIDGVIYMASPDTEHANDLNGFVYVLMLGYNSAKKLGGRVFFSRFAYRLTKYRAPEPDVGYVRPERVHLITKREMKGPPDIAVEIVSRDSRTRDYRDKKELYQQAGVTEYWIIDPLKQRVQFFRLENGRYESVPLQDGHILRSEVLPGFWLDVRWLLAEPLPSSFACLQEILQSSPSA